MIEYVFTAGGSLREWIEGVYESISNVVAPIATNWEVIFGGAALIFFIILIAKRRK